MGSHRRHTPLLLALLLAGAASAATLQPQPQVPGYGKEFRQFGNYNGIPIAPRPSPWIRAAEIQSADAAVYPGERQQPSFPEQQVPFGNAVFLQRRGPQYPVLPAPPEQRAPPADGFIYQRMGPPPLGPGQYNGDQVPQKYEHSMLLIDHPPGQMMSQQQQPDQQTMASGDQVPQKYEHSMLLIDHPPEQMMSQQQQPDQQTIVRREDSAAGEPVQYEHSMLEVDHPVDGTSQQQEQQPDMSGNPMAAGSPAEETIQVQVPSGDQQPSAQESSGAIAQVTLQDSSVPQGAMTPMLMPYQQGQRPLSVIFQSNEPYPGLSPPPAYQPEQVAWGVAPVHMPVYPAPFRQQPPQQEQQPRAPAGYPDDFQVKGGYQPFLSQRQAYNPPLVSFGMPPVAEDRTGAVPPPPGGVAPFPMPPSYVPETPLEETSQAEVVPDKSEQSESRETEKGKDDDAKDDDEDDASDEIENKVKALKDAVDVEEEVVPALVVFLRKKGHKAFHDKDSVGIPGKEDRFRRSPGGASGSSSHSSSSSSSSSGPLYFGDGGGSYSSSQSSASSSSGGGAPLGLGAGAPGLGGGNAFHGGGHVPSSGYGVSGGGGSGGYGNTGYGNTGYGSSGYGGGAGGGGGGGGGGGYGGSGYGGVGPSGGGGSYGGGCPTCGDDSNVLLNRFGEVEGGGPFTVGGSGSSKGQGVHSSASSSIDSTGKVTYTAFAGKH